jgi:uncharacterized protein YjbI with pentapeptide repeats
MTWTAGSSIPAGLAENQTIRDLDLTNCQFGEGSIPALARAFEQNGSLHVLRLDNCVLHDEDIACIVSSLCQNPSLQGLDLKDNSCGTKGLGVLVQLLERTHISWLRLQRQRYTNNFLDVSLLTCALNDSNTSLILLNLSFNAISDRGISDLTTALLQNRTLRHVNLNYCHLTDVSMLRIAQCLPSMEGLWKLYLQGGQSGEAIDQAMVNGLEQHKQLQVLELPPSFRQPKEIEYYLDLNRSGRRLITERILQGLWPLVLEQAWNQMKGRKNGHERCANVFYFFLHNRILTENG